METNDRIFYNRCKKRRGCSIADDSMFWDKQPDIIHSAVYGTRDDIPKVLSMVELSLDKELEKERQMEEIYS